MEHRNAAWSADGSRIVFTSARTGFGQVYVMDAEGGNVTQLTFDDVFKDQVPDWSPGQAIPSGLPSGNRLEAD